ncbi:MAG: hypothetical protein KJO03_10310, partial [Gammaproteobacteria bacterium]|nr:hypothetical protein [Gammaproteobacteria bacterium]
MADIKAQQGAGGSKMISLLWPWAFAALPLPFIFRLILPRAKTNDAALRVSQLNDFQLSDSASSSGSAS